MSDKSLGSANGTQPGGDRDINRLAFFAGFLRNPQEVGSVIPSSRFLEKRILEAADLSHAKLVVELGPGTGGTTRSFLRQLSSDARLLTIDSNPDFIKLLNGIDDPRLINHHGSAEDLARILRERDLGSPDAVISGIPFSTIPGPIGSGIIKAVRDALAHRGRFVAYQFRGEVATLARPIMGEPDRLLEIRNIPPMRVYRWQKTVNGYAEA